MFAIVSSSTIKSNPNYKSFIEETFTNKSKYKLNTQGTVLSFHVETIEELYNLFTTLYVKTGVMCTYRVSKFSGIDERFIIQEKKKFI